MKIIDAFWEERNLGVTCYEMNIELVDSTEKAAAALESLTERQYMVAKVPSPRCDLVQLYQSKGYRFMETAIKLEYNYKKAGKTDVSPGLRRICDRCTWRLMDETDLSQLSNEIYSGIFKTDRINNDPSFTHEQAARRYDLWVKDLVKQGNIPRKVILDNEVVGFFVNREISPKVYDGLLAGVYNGYEGTGMGYCIQYVGILSALKKGAKRYIGHVSASNPAVLKILLSLGFAIKNMEYVLVKHNN